MEALISQAQALSIEKFYFLGLVLCLVLNVKHKKLFSLTLITLFFNAFSQLFYFDFLYNKGSEYWDLGWSAYELLIIMTIFGVRMCDRKSHTKFVLSDLLLMFTGLYGILIYLLAFICMKNNYSWMNVIYAASAPAMYAYTIFVLILPSFYKFISWFKGYKDFSHGCNNTNNDSIFNAKWRHYILGS